MSLWIDAVAKPLICDGAALSEDEHAAMVASSLRQCAFWCLWDLRTHAPVGWSYNGRVGSFQFR